MADVRDVCGWIVFMVIGWFLMLFISVPAVQWIWDVLVYPSYPIHISKGIVLFASIIFTLFNFKPFPNKEVTLSDGVSAMILYYILLALLCISTLFYSFFL